MMGDFTFAEREHARRVEDHWARVIAAYPCEVAARQHDMTERQWADQNPFVDDTEVFREFVS